MNIALPALIVFILLLPGFIARSRIKRVEATTLDYSPFGRTVTEAVLVAGGLHVLWIWATGLLGEIFAPEILLTLFSVEAPTQTKALKELAGQASDVTKYFATLYVFAFFAPAAIRWCITKWRLDREGACLSSLFRFHRAPWYYLFSRSDLEDIEKCDVIAISAIVDIAGTAYLYSGLLEEYFCDQNGDLDRMVLRWVMRRPLAKDKILAVPLETMAVSVPEPSIEAAVASSKDIVEAEQRFYPVDGDYFVLRYSETITLNFEYLNLEGYVKIRGGAAVKRQ